jgi:TPR repeat protein
MNATADIQRCTHSGWEEFRKMVAHGMLFEVVEWLESPEYNAEEAFCCWSQVAERPRGDLRFMAMLTLARCCRDGTGTDLDRQKARQWLDRLMALAPKEKADYRYAAKLRKEIDEELL